LLLNNLNRNKTIKRNLIWTTIRTLTFLIIGLMNTALIKPEDIGTWKNYVGYAFFLVAVLDTIYLSTQLKKEKK
jgi:hypothetical protein